MFASHLDKEGLSHQSVKVYLAAVRNLPVTAGKHAEYAKALTPCLELVLKGIKKESAKYHPLHIHLPITLKIMQSIHSILEAVLEAHDNILMWAAHFLVF